jgi:hypothetical protein
VRAIEPWAVALRDIAKVGYQSTYAGGGPRQQPDIDSTAMRELDAQMAYAGAWDSHPVDTAYTHIGLLMTAGEDAMLAFADLVTADRTPTYSYLPVARAGIEWLALAHWLSEPEIGVRERVRRSLNERIASAYEQSRLPSGANPEPERQARLLEATHLGYTMTQSKKGRLRALAPERPSITAHVQRVLGGDRLGQLVYSYLSAISHGTLWGLVQRAEPLDPNATGPVVTAGLAVSSDDIAMLAVALITAHITAFGGYVKLLGWDMLEWRDAVLRSSPLVMSYANRHAESNTSSR